MTKIPPTERIVSSFKRLASSSDKLNAAAVDLGKTISTLDSALEKLNLGVSAWHRVAGDEDDGNYWSRDIGYSRVGRKWGIAIRKASGNENFEHHEEEVWLFNDAPRWMQVESVGKLPDLFDDLIERTEETTKKIKAKTSETQELAAAIEAVASEVVPKHR
jgi:hypothetical protein